MIAVYARQSIDKKDSISIDTQIEYCRHEAANTDDIKTYIDKGYSGKNTNRPAFEQMMADISSGLITTVIVYRLDRVSRSIVDFADFINTLENKKTSFISATEKFDTSSPMGRAMLYIIAVFAQLERETIAQRIKDNYYERIKRGAVGGGPAPYGFTLAKKTTNGIKTTVYEPDKNLKNVVLMFKKYSEPTSSLADVQRMLMEKGILTATEHGWDNAKINSILKSPVYVRADAAIYNYYKLKGAEVANDISEFNGENGCILAGKRASNTRKYTDVKDHVLAISNHKGIIDSGTFLYVQNKLSANKQIKNTGKGKHSWLTGYVKCGYCGYSMAIRQSMCKDTLVKYFYDSGKYLYKICSEKQTHRVNDIEDYVEKKLIKYSKAYETELNNSQPSEDNDILNKIADIDSKIEALISSLETASDVTMGYINKRIEALDAEKQTLLNQQTALVQKRQRFSLPDLDYNNLSFNDKKMLLEIFVDRVLLTRDTVKIVWK